MLASLPQLRVRANKSRHADRLPPARVELSRTTEKATSGFMDTIMIGMARALVRNDSAWSMIGTAARNEILKTAEESGLKVNDFQADMEASGVHKVFSEIQNPDINYPDYYVQKFHAYSEGNLNWTAAYEAQYSWTSVAVKVYRDTAEANTITPERASASWNRDVENVIRSYCKSQDVALPVDVVDVGCSVGYSTRGLRNSFPDMNILGVDASPYFLAIAETQERNDGDKEGRSRLNYVHAMFEQCDLPDQSMDMVLFQFMFHECPAAAIKANLERAVRLVKPGGIVAFVDVDPYAEALQKLPAFVKALRWATEPWLDEYENVDFPVVMESVGLTNVERLQKGRRHHGYFSRVPC